MNLYCVQSQSRTIWDQTANSRRLLFVKDIRFRGWSVDRRYFTGLWRVKLSHAEWKKKKPHLNKIDVLPISVAEIRRQNPKTGQQDFVVTDTAVWLNPVMRLFYYQFHEAKVRRAA